MMVGSERAGGRNTAHSIMITHTHNKRKVFAVRHINKKTGIITESSYWDTISSAKAHLSRHYNDDTNYSGITLTKKDWLQEFEIVTYELTELSSEPAVNLVKH